MYQLEVNRDQSPSSSQTGWQKCRKCWKKRRKSLPCSFCTSVQNEKDKEKVKKSQKQHTKTVLTDSKTNLTSKVLLARSNGAEVVSGDVDHHEGKEGQTVNLKLTENM